MRKPLVIGIGLLAALGGCGLEGFLGNVGRKGSERPASVIRGQATWPGALASQLLVTDGDYGELEVFQSSLSVGAYEVRLPSSKYSMALMQARPGDMNLRTIVPFVGEESAVDGVDLDARSMTETLVVEARLSADGKGFKQLEPDAYLGTRELIQAGMDQPGPTQDLLRMVERFIPKNDPTSGVAEPSFFRVPTATRLPDGTIQVTSSPIDLSWLLRSQLDYDGDGIPDDSTAKFDAKLAAAAPLYDPSGCPDTTRVRLVFTVDFNEGGKNGNCAGIDRFKWAKDAPGKSMFFVGWVHRDSVVQDAAVNAMLGGSTPNQVQMYDDGSNGDETAGDNVWTIYFDVPRGDPATSSVLRIGYKYTWGTRGAVWTGSEEWPGNSRIIEVRDLNGDNFVYRRDVFGDEATNKDRANLNLTGTGSIDWTTDLHGCGVPEARENKYVNSQCSCGDWATPVALGPITVRCPVP